MKKKGLKEYIVISNKNGKLFMLKPSYSKKYLSQFFIKMSIYSNPMSVCGKNPTAFCSVKLLAPL